jgi:hypothetical protein
MCSHPHHTHGDHEHHHHWSHHHTHHGGDDGTGPTGALDHGAGLPGGAEAHGALLGDGVSALVVGNLDLGGTQIDLAAIHAAGLTGPGHGIDAVIAGNVNNGGIQINVIEVEVVSPGHTLPVH